jgi:hypothetical protein
MGGIIMSVGILLILWATFWHFAMDMTAQTPMYLAALGMVLIALGSL